MNKLIIDKNYHNTTVSLTEMKSHMAKELLNMVFSTFRKRNDTNKMIKTVIQSNGDRDGGRYQAFHEITQLIAGSEIHKRTGQDTQLEYHIEKEIPWRPNKHYWVDIVTGDNYIEIMPII